MSEKLEKLGEAEFSYSSPFKAYCSSEPASLRTSSKASLFFILTALPTFSSYTF
jgi:hypothetical protein